MIRSHGIEYDEYDGLCVRRGPERLGSERLERAVQIREYCGRQQQQSGKERRA
jgi:hypothetical protein